VGFCGVVVVPPMAAAMIAPGRGRAMPRALCRININAMRDTGGSVVWPVSLAPAFDRI